MSIPDKYLFDPRTQADLNYATLREDVDAKRNAMESELKAMRLDQKHGIGRNKNVLYETNPVNRFGVWSYSDNGFTVTEEDGETVFTPVVETQGFSEPEPLPEDEVQPHANHQVTVGGDAMSDNTSGTVDEDSDHQFNYGTLRKPVTGEEADSDNYQRDESHYGHTTEKDDHEEVESLKEEDESDSTDESEDTDSEDPEENTPDLGDESSSEELNYSSEDDSEENTSDEQDNSETELSGGAYENLPEDTGDVSDEDSNAFRDSLDGLTNKELKEIESAHDLETSGNKSEHHDRLVEHFNSLSTFEQVQLQEEVDAKKE